MSAHPNYSRATIAGHPIHVMLVSFPIAFYTAGLASLIAHAVTGSLFAFRLAYLGLLGGACVAVVAAIFGAIDLFAIEREAPARRTGLQHMGLNLASTVLFAVAGFLAYREYAGRTVGESAELAYGGALALAIVAFVGTGAAGWLGWKLVQTHHVGVDDRPRFEREYDDRPAPWRRHGSGTISSLH
jgi:uncharacterized membrane protein